MRKIVVLDGYTLNPGDISWDAFSELGELVVHDRTDPQLVAERIEDAEIVLTNKTVICSSDLEQAKKLEYIGILATGLNIVDLPAATANNIVVTNVPSYGPEAVSQYAIALLLEIASQVGLHSRAVLDGAWQTQEDFAFTLSPLIELNGKNCGIIGLGAIGGQTARVVQALGMKVYAHTFDPDPALESDSLRFVDLPTLYENADVIFLHCPLTAENAHFINRESIAQMRDGVIIINNARGGLIQEDDLAEALNSGKVYAAGVDVVSSEPISPDNPLLKAKNIFITPHISWAAKETRARLMQMAADNLKAFLKGEDLNKVNQRDESIGRKPLP
ncbi:MAG: D-2-hydroxyacid dehydrogenase [Clostridiaceae bacterium]|nr:D-2-hydroxyacid dehydrogenase [Clostridiaceae bacterium]